MINAKKVIVVLPAYNASKTLEMTYNEIDFSIVDDVILVDDRSKDDTVEVAKKLGIKHIVVHEQNKGYGGNQKTCYNTALQLGADIVIMLHPDYQYTPKLIPSMAHLLSSGLYHVALGSRILGKGALKGGMPMIKYIANRGLTLAQNILMNAKLSEYHTGYRAFTREVLEKVNYNANSDNFVFDNQMLAQIWYAGYEIAEITCPTKYFDDASSINLKNSSIYGLGVLKTSLQYRFQKWGLIKSKYLINTEEEKDPAKKKEIRLNWLLTYLTPLILFLVAFIWKFTHIGIRDICIDEPFTIFNAQDSILNILKLPLQNEPTPPLFMLLLHFWIKLFGISAQSVRVLPILFNALTAVYLYFIGKRFFTVWSGLTASLLFIFSTLHFYFGADTRTYAMLSFATACSLYYLLLILKNPDSRKGFVGLIVSNLILIYGHYFGLLVIFMQFMVSFLYFGNKPIFKKILKALVITGILYLPMIIVLIKQFLISKNGTWLSPPQGSDYIREMKSFLNSETGFMVTVYILGAGLLFALFSRIKKEQIRGIVLLFVWWFIPYTLMFVVSSKIPMFTNRYILFNSIGFYLFIAVAISIFYQRIKFVAPVVSLVLVVLMCINIFTGDSAPRKVKAASDYIKSKMDANSSLIIYPHWADLGLMYYYDQAIFKSVNDYPLKLQEKKIYQAWGVEDMMDFCKNNNPKRIILYQDNPPLTNSKREKFQFLYELYSRTDSVSFESGLTVCIFDEIKNDFETQ